MVALRSRAEDRPRGGTEIDRQKAISALNASMARVVEELERVGKALTNAETLHGEAEDLCGEKARQIKQVLEKQ